MKKTKLLFVCCAFMLISSLLVSCGKKDFDDELVIHYFSDDGWDPYIKANKKFYRQYGLEVPKYKTKGNKEILGHNYFKSEEANNYIINAVKSRDFYERTSNVEGLYDDYNYVVNNIKRDYLTYFIEIKEFLPPLKDYFGTFEDYKNTDYQLFDTAVGGLYGLEKLRFNLWAENEGREVLTEIGKEIYKKYVALYNGTFYTESLKILKSKGFSKEEIAKERYRYCNKIFDLIFGNKDYDKKRIADYLPTDMYYLVCNSPKEARSAKQYEYYKSAISQHDKNNEKDSKYYDEMKRCVELFDKLANTDWKLFWMDGEGSITDSDCDVNRVLQIKKPQDCTYNMNSNKVSEGYCYFENGKLKTYNSYWKGNDLTEQYDGFFTISTNADGKEILTWSGLCKLYDYGSVFPYKLKFSE